MPTTSIPVVEGLSIGDGVTHTLVPAPKVGAPTDILTFGEVVAYQLIRSGLNVAVSHGVHVAASASPDPLTGEAHAATVTTLIGVRRQSGRSVLDRVVITDYVSYFIASASWVNPSVPVPTPAAHLTLTHGGTVVTLRKPDFGDADTYDLFRVSRQSRGGDIQILSDPMWPVTETLSFKFSYLDPDVVESLLVFLKSTAGATVTLLDHYGRTWTGVVLTPAGEAVQDKRTTSTAAFKFQIVTGPA